MLNANTPPVIAFVGFSGSGKTSLLVKVLPLLCARGLRVGMLKHAHHRFDIDHPGKDSHELRKAGAAQMLIASDARWALMVENAAPVEPRIADLLPHLDTTQLDLVLAEGFKHDACAKIEIHRPALGHPLLYPEDKAIIAVVTDAALSPAPAVPVLDINDPAQIAEYICNTLSLRERVGVRARNTEPP